MNGHPPISTLFPYPTLFRSRSARHAEPLVPARDPLGRAAARAVALAAARVALRARRPAGPLSPRDLRGLRRRRDGLAERDARRLLARVGLAGSARPHRGGGLPLAPSSRHPALAVPPGPSAPLPRC